MHDLIDEKRSFLSIGLKAKISDIDLDHISENIIQSLPVPYQFCLAINNQNFRRP
jgi:hypothetical protein